MSTVQDSFSLSEEKLLADDAKFISWCPTTDLVLLISPSNTLSLYRSGISIVKIWSIQHPDSANVNSVAWKPNGKEFVLGCDNGVVYKVDITYHTPVISPCWIPSTQDSQSAFPILSLVWTNYEYKKKKIDIEGFDIGAFDLESALPTLSQEPPEEPLSRMPMAKKKKIQLPPIPLKHDEIQTLLFVGDGKGEIHIILNGLYPIGSFALDSNINLEAIEISVSQDMSSLLIMTKPKSSASDFILYAIDTQILNDRKEEIHSISDIQTQLNYLLQYSKCTMDVLKRHHDAFSSFTASVAKQASNYITIHNEDTSAMPEVELFATLATGNITESLQKFFTEYLIPQRIKQWESNVKHGYHNSLVIICEHILPACERIQLQLSKLLGYSLWTQRYGDFLKTEAVEKCIDKTRKLIFEVYEYSKSLGSLIKSFDAFFRWIIMVSRKIDGHDSTEEHQSILCENPELVASFLEKDFVQDSLDIYFNQKVNKNLVYLLYDLFDCCTEMLKRPSETISAKLQVVSISKMRLIGVSIDEQPRKKMISFTSSIENGQQTIFYAMLQTKPEAQLIILKKKFDDSLMTYGAYSLNGTISDFEFFDTKELGILIQTDKETTMLQAIPLDDICFQKSTSNKLVTASKLIHTRSQQLQRMIHVKLGCNGLPRRRVLCVVASNGILKVYFMDTTEDSEEDSEEDNGHE